MFGQFAEYTLYFQAGVMANILLYGIQLSQVRLFHSGA